MATDLPSNLERKLERFKKAKGSKWAKELEKMLDESLRLIEWDAEVRKPGPKAASIAEKEAIAMALEAVREVRQGKR